MAEIMRATSYVALVFARMARAPTGDVPADAPGWPSPEEIPHVPVGRRIAVGTVSQQAALGIAVAVSVVTFTALGRTLSLAELGVYGLTVSFTTYLYFALASAETAAVKTISEALTPGDRDRAFTTAVFVYGVFGLIAGIVVAVGGSLLVGVLGFSSGLVHEARLGVLALGAGMVIGWPLRAFQDVLRADQRFVRASAADAIAALLQATGLLVLLATDQPLWTLIAVGGSAPLFAGLASLAVRPGLGTLPRMKPRLLERSRTREFLRIAGLMFVTAASDLAINSLDRTIVAAFRSASTIGLYEAAVRPNQLIRTFTGSFSVTLLPVMSRLRAEGDRMRETELFVRGTRYMLAAVVPPTVAFMVLADKLLTAWLGDKFEPAAGATAIFLAWWLFAPSASVASTMFVVEGRVGRLAAYAWLIAGVNLTLSIVLTWQLGLVGVAIGTTIGYLVAFPLFMREALRTTTVSVGEFARRVWLPAYAVGAALAAALALTRLVLPLNSILELAVVCIAGVLLAWAAFYRLCMDSDERAILRGLVRG
jgi:O-antigen/teichoic acid export membrane protein